MARQFQILNMDLQIFTFVLQLLTAELKASRGKILSKESCGSS